MIVAAAGIGGVYLAASGPERSRATRPVMANTEGEIGEAAGSAPRVEVVKPHRGGMERTTQQPGTIRAFEFARLYAKVSGYLDQLKVDRGSRVKKGELLLEISDPELNAAVAQAQAELEHSQAAVVQARERIKVAEAMLEARVTQERKAVADLEHASAMRVHQEKQFRRFGELAQRNALEQRLVDEQEDEYHSALAGEHAGQAGIETAKAQITEAKAEVRKAEADLVAAKADVDVSKANLQKSQVFLEYTRLNSPYDGVVIYRGEAVHPGAFIQAAVQGAGDPLLTVARDDVMRTIIQVPDRDVPSCDLGDPAIIRLDALHGRPFQGVVSRIAESEDIQDRTMRVEVDLPNPDHVLKDGMFGRAEILLEKASANLTLPSSCLIEQNSRGEGSILVVRDGMTHRQQVQVGRDDGLRVEILSGLGPDDQVILQPDTSRAEGTPVLVEAATPSTPPSTPAESPAHP